MACSRRPLGMHEAPPMTDQPSFLWPGADETCPRCRGQGDVYYLNVSQPGAEIVGGKRIPCPACHGLGAIRVPAQAPAASGDAGKRG